MRRLVDEVANEWAARGEPLAYAPQIVGVFADLLWEQELNEIETQLAADPAFIVRHGSRMVAFQRTNGQLRYYLGVVPEKVGLVDEREEAGVLYSVADAAQLAGWYLRGGAIISVPVERFLKRVSGNP